MSDPYMVLEVSPNASNDDIKKAYRRLSRIYHPDANINNPDKAKAEEQFKKIQEAYNQIMKDREWGYRGGFDSSGCNPSDYASREFYSYGRETDKEDQESLEMNAAFHYINSGYYREALHVLSGIASRNARWYFYSAAANAGLGNNINAIKDARQAVALEPDNKEYRSYLERLAYAGEWYQNKGTRNHRIPESTGNLCYHLCLLTVLCNCCLLKPC